MATESSIGATGQGREGVAASQLSGVVFRAKGQSGAGRASLLGVFSSLGQETGAASASGTASFREGWQKLLAQMSKGAGSMPGTATATDAAGQTAEELLQIPAAATGQTQNSSLTANLQKTAATGSQAAADSSDLSASATGQNTILAASLTNTGQATSTAVKEISSTKDSLSTSRSNGEPRGSKSAAQKKDAGSDATAQTAAGQFTAVDASAAGTLTVPSMAAVVSTPQPAAQSSVNTDEDAVAAVESGKSGSGLSAAAFGTESAPIRSTAFAGQPAASVASTPASSSAAAGMAQTPAERTSSASGNEISSQAATAPTVPAIAATPATHEDNAVISPARATISSANTAVAVSPSTPTLDAAAQVSTDTQTAPSGQVASASLVQVPALPSGSATQIGQPATTEIASVASETVQGTGAEHGSMQTTAVRAQSASKAVVRTGTQPASGVQSKSILTDSASAAESSATIATRFSTSGASSANGQDAGSTLHGETAVLSDSEKPVVATENLSANSSVDAAGSNSAIALGATEKSATETSSSVKTAISERKSTKIAATTATSAATRAGGVTAAGVTAAIVPDMGGRPEAVGRETSGAGSHAAVSTVSDTFTSLDSGELPGKGTWVHAGSHTAEAGYQDPALGWVGVRADMSGGSVHATLVPGSSSAADTLSGQMAGLHGYLAEHHSSVSTISVATPDNSQTGMDFSQGRGNESGGQNGQGQTAASNNVQSTISTDLRTGSSSQRTASSLSDTVSLPAFGADGGSVGMHFSVVA